MIKPETRVAKKNSLKQHVEQTLMGTRFKRKTILFWMTAGIMNHYPCTTAYYIIKQYKTVQKYVESMRMFSMSILCTGMSR